MATTQVDAVLKVEGEDGTSRPLSTTDLATSRTGAATQATLAEVLVELGQKLEPADLAVLATAARQDAAKNVLDAISQAVGAPATDTLLSLLQAIRTNTASEVATVSTLQLTADQVQLNTDTVEALLGHLTDGTQQVIFTPPAGATVTQVASSATAVTLQAANAGRRGLHIFNDSTSVLYVKLGTGASASSYTVKLQPGDYYELPVPFYRGAVSGVWATANGNALVTEVA